jgi:FkbM family methyltransferase
MSQPNALSSPPPQTPLLKQVVRALLPVSTRHVLRHVASCARHPEVVGRAMGVRGTVRLFWVPVWHELRRLTSTGGAGKTYALTAADAQYPMACRVGSSDVDVFRQIFVEREYQCVDDLAEPRWLIDCGANVGFATAWFLSRYPTMRAIAVEPDPTNAAMLRRNLAPFGHRATVVETGVWSRPASLRVVRGAFGDGREWATQVVECAPGEPHDLVAVDIPTLIAQAGGGAIDVLKIDIEGAEGELFAQGQPEWLASVENLVIEIHGPVLETLVDGAIPADEFSRSRSGELTCYRRTGARRAAAGASRTAPPLAPAAAR